MGVAVVLVMVAVVVVVAMAMAVVAAAVGRPCRGNESRALWTSQHLGEGQHRSEMFCK